jgi:hypothetical protein
VLINAESLKLETTTLDALMGVQPTEQPASKLKERKPNGKAVKRQRKNKETAKAA